MVTSVVRYYLPAQRSMDAAGELVRPGADEIVRTGLDYPSRNVYQLGQCVGLVAVTGMKGTLEELVLALVEHDMPTAALRDSGPAARGLELLLPLFPDWPPRVLLGDDPAETAAWVLEGLK